MNIMKPGRLQEVTTALWATCALINGGVALSHNSEAARDEATAAVYQQQGNYGQAAQFEAQASDEQLDRDIYLGLTALNLGLVGLNGSLALAARNRRREEEQQAEEQQPQI